MSFYTQNVFFLETDIDLDLSLNEDHISEAEYLSMTAKVEHRGDTQTQDVLGYFMEDEPDSGTFSALPWITDIVTAVAETTTNSNLDVEFFVDSELIAPRVDSQSLPPTQPYMYVNGNGNEPETECEPAEVDLHV